MRNLSLPTAWTMTEATTMAATTMAAVITEIMLTILTSLPPQRIRQTTRKKEIFMNKSVVKP